MVAEGAMQSLSTSSVALPQTPQPGPDFVMTKADLAIAEIHEIPEEEIKTFTLARRAIAKFAKENLEARGETKKALLNQAKADPETPIIPGPEDKLVSELYGEDVYKVALSRARTKRELELFIEFQRADRINNPSQESY
jgi:hypothetical protein